MLYIIFKYTICAANNAESIAVLHDLISWTEH